MHRAESGIKELKEELKKAHEDNVTYVRGVSQSIIFLGVGSIVRPE